MGANIFLGVENPKDTIPGFCAHHKNFKVRLVSSVLRKILT